MATSLSYSGTNEPSDRTWPLPKRPWVMRMTWSELLFAHWPVEPRRVADLLPEGLNLDTFDGQAWVGVVPFRMSNVAPRWCPALPGLGRFPELNVRTYVTMNDKPGVWFFSLDAASWIAVRAARAAFHLPYMDASMAIKLKPDGQIDYRSQRTHRNEPHAEFHACYGVAGQFAEAVPGSLEHWLTARYCLYSSNHQGQIYRGEIAHPPWKLAPATYTQHTNTMGQPHGFDFQGPPHLLMAEPVDVLAWYLTR